MLRIAGLTVSVALYGAAIVFATTPWRVHGGRFVTEYLLLGGAVGLVGVGLTAATLRWT
jgi:hypothetical protein